MNGVKKFWTPTEAAEVMNVSRERIWQIIYDGQLKIDTIGNQTIIEREDLLDLIQRRKADPRAKEAKSVV